MIWSSHVCSSKWTEQVARACFDIFPAQLKLLHRQVLAVPIACASLWCIVRSEWYRGETISSSDTLGLFFDIPQLPRTFKIARYKITWTYTISHCFETNIEIAFIFPPQESDGDDSIAKAVELGCVNYESSVPSALFSKLPFTVAMKN